MVAFKTFVPAFLICSVSQTDSIFGRKKSFRALSGPIKQAFKANGARNLAMMRFYDAEGQVIRSYPGQENKEARNAHINVLKANAKLTAFGEFVDPKFLHKILAQKPETSGPTTDAILSGMSVKIANEYKQTLVFLEQAVKIKQIFSVAQAKVILESCNVGRVASEAFIDTFTKYGETSEYKYIEAQDLRDIVVAFNPKEKTSSQTTSINPSPSAPHTTVPTGEKTSQPTRGFSTSAKDSKLFDHLAFLDRAVEKKFKFTVDDAEELLAHCNLTSLSVARSLNDSTKTGEFGNYVEAKDLRGIVNSKISTPISDKASPSQTSNQTRAFSTSSKRDASSAAAVSDIKEVEVTGDSDLAFRDEVVHFLERAKENDQRFSVPYAKNLLWMCGLDSETVLKLDEKTNKLDYDNYVEAEDLYALVSNGIRELGKSSVGQEEATLEHLCFLDEQLGFLDKAVEMNRKFSYKDAEELLVNCALDGEISKAFLAENAKSNENTTAHLEAKALRDILKKSL